MKNIDASFHTTGKSLYIDDIRLADDTLHAAVFYSTTAHAKIRKLDLSKARNSCGVHAVYTAADIPGENQIGGIIPDEPLLAEGEVHFFGQPIAIVIAETERQAQDAVEKIRLDVEELSVITDPREAASKGQLIMDEPIVFSCGDTISAFQKCDVVVEGVAESGGQEHLYLEPQGAIALPTENGGVKIHSSTQSPTAVQRVTAKVLNLAMHMVEVDVQRLGGGFGGKEDQATPWAAMVSLAAVKLQRPVKLVLHRIDDMRMTGKRHPYSSDFKIGLSQDGKILAYEVTFYQNAGAAADLSPAVLARSIFHATNSYFIPNVVATGYSCKTNLPPNTAFRGFGGPQGMFVMEAAIHKAAEAMKKPAYEIQKLNLLDEGDAFPYAQKAEQCQAKSCFALAEEKFKLKAMIAEIDAFNTKQKQFKRALACTPVCFGISFTKTLMNQASALIHIYQDGSVAVTTGAVEMGQGVNTKILQVVADILSLSPSRIKIMSTNTTRIANSSPTAASSGADLNGKAAEKAALQLVERLNALDRKELAWNDLIALAYEQRVNLSAHAHYATPEIFFDEVTSKGSPFAYHVYGTAITVVTLDGLRGRYTVDSVKIVHDFGRALNPLIDLGQIEGGLMQGIGWMTLEELLFTDDGRPMTDTLSTYKVPDIYSAPKELLVEALPHADNPKGVAKSKATGEPPFMYGIGSFFALREAMKAFSGLRELPLQAPLTPERVLMTICPEVENEVTYNA